MNAQRCAPLSAVIRGSMLAVLLLLLVSTTSPSLADISVQDFAGRTVRLPQPARRIVALAPHIVENVFSAGAGDKLVGVVSYSDYPDQARDIERVGNFQAWSLEAIIALQPDLILLWGSGNGMETLSALERMGIPVFVSELRQLEHIPASIRAIGELAGTAAASEAEAQRIERALAALRRQYQHRQPVSVFYQIWNEPLQTINGEHMISQLIDLCGGRNVFADTRLLAPKINIESVLARDPDAIIASGMGAARPEWLDNWRGYGSLQAVRNGALFFIPPDHMQRPTARIVAGARTLCAQLDSSRK